MTSGLYWVISTYE